MIREGLTFDDVLLVPQFSEVKSRSTVDISVQLAPGLKRYSHPVIPANMKTVTGLEMAWEIVRSGGLAILHRFMLLEEQGWIAEDIIDQFGPGSVAVSVGVKEEDVANIPFFLEKGVSIFCIDVAHGDSRQTIEMIKAIKAASQETTVIAGNVATGKAAGRLWRAGADVVKVGVGPGSLCTTRIETGNGVPQLTALMDVSDVREVLQRNSNGERTYSIIADGGIKSAGDIVKALCFADMVMVGNIFAGAEETPGQILSIEGKPYKEYVGSSTHKTNHIEGVAALVPTKGKYVDILQKLLEGLRSGCSYQGVETISQLQEAPEFIRITNAGLKESHPHDVVL